MNIYRLAFTTVLMISSITSFGQAPQTLDLHKLVKDDGIDFFNRELTLINEEGRLGISLSKDPGEGIACLSSISIPASIQTNIPLSSQIPNFKNIHSFSSSCFTNN